jgi:hypothetical protein
MTSDQPSPGTSGQPVDPGEPPPAREVIAVAGPWTVLYCLTAACTSCGAVPLDAGASTIPHFASTDQAAQELAQDWGWHHKRGEWPKDDELLCPRCAALPPKPASPRIGRSPGHGAADVFSALPRR